VSRETPFGVFATADLPMVLLCVLRLRRRLRFMALVNVVLGPAIAVYLVVYSFFRYFEVRRCPLSYSWCAARTALTSNLPGPRSTTRTRPRSAAGLIRPRRGGSSASTTSSRTSLSGGLPAPSRSLASTSTSSPKNE
jgi:hypothetical protein